MSRTNKIIKYTFGILTLALVLFPFRSTALAQFMPVQGYRSGFDPNYYQAPVVAPQPQVVVVPTPTIYSTSTNPNQTVASPASKPKTVAKATSTPPPTAETADDKYALLTASAILGGSGFMPTGLISWTLLGVLLLLMIIIVRKIAGGDKMYHSTPLKHN